MGVDMKTADDVTTHTEDSATETTTESVTATERTTATEHTTDSEPVSE